MWRLYAAVGLIVACLSAVVVILGMNLLESFEASAIAKGKLSCVADVNSATIKKQAEQIAGLRKQLSDDKERTESLSRDLIDAQIEKDLADATLEKMTVKLNRIDNSIVDSLNAPVRGYKGESK